MKKYILSILLIVLALGCETESKLTFEMFQLQNDNCANCPEIRIEIPKALNDSRIAEAINTAITEEVIYVLQWEENETVSSLKEAMASFTKSYQGLQKKFNDETVPWDAEINGEVIYETESVLSIGLNTYTFTGGAHGYGANLLLNFDKIKALEIENYELFDDLQGFITYAEKRFRVEQEIPFEGNINTTGFMFTGDAFHLSENMGFTEKGVQLIYNQYEVASYADGPIMLLIPFKEANPFLKATYRAELD